MPYILINKKKLYHSSNCQGTIIKTVPPLLACCSNAAEAPNLLTPYRVSSSLSKNTDI